MTPNEELHAGADSGDPARVATALAAGADVNSQDRGWTALSRLCVRREASEGHLECFNLLLAAGADHQPQKGSKLDWTPLHWAAMHAPDGHAQCVAALLEAGANPVARDIFGEVPLHHAARHGRLDAARLLAEAAPHGVVLVQANLGQTPLHRALDNGHTPVATYLVGGVRLSSLEVDSALRAIQHAGARDPEHQRRLLLALVSRQRLTATQWESIPSPCLGIGTALSAVLQRSGAEAALLLRRMPASERQRLRTLALCLARAQRTGQLPDLPIHIVDRLLAEAAAVQAPLVMPQR